MSSALQVYKVQYMPTGHIRSVEARGYKNAKDIFKIRYQPPKGEWLHVWPDGQPESKRRMRT